MALLDHIYFDAALTNQFDDTTDTLTLQATNGNSADGSFYIGTPTAGNKVEDATTPGVDPIVASIVDSAPGGGVEAAHVKLSLTELGLDGAVGGDPLNVATTINYGSPVQVWYRWTNSTGSGTSTEIDVSVSSRSESAI